MWVDLDHSSQDVEGRDHRPWSSKVKVVGQANPVGPTSIEGSFLLVVHVFAAVSLGKFLHCMRFSAKREAVCRVNGETALRIFTLSARPVAFGVQSGTASAHLRL